MPPVDKLDVLVVIDNSPSPTGQEELARDLGHLFQRLREVRGSLPSVHVGIVSSDMGAGGVTNLSSNCRSSDGGRLQAKVGCGVAESDRFLIDDGAGGRNYQGELGDVLPCLGLLGSDGCGYEHHLAAARAALSGQVPENAGFLRDDAYLLLIVHGDEDDCSGRPGTDLFTSARPGESSSLLCALAGHQCDGRHPAPPPFSAPLASCAAAPDGGGQLVPVADLVRDVRASKRDPRMIFAAGYFGWPPYDQQAFSYSIDKVSFAPDAWWDLRPVCNVPNVGSATVGLRMKAFVESFGPRALWSTVCQPSARRFLEQLAELVAAADRPAP